MKGLRFLLLGLVICLASGVKAQFYDSADDIYFYVQYEHESGVAMSDGSIKKKTMVYRDGDNSTLTQIFNFDGKKAAVLEGLEVEVVKDHLKNNPSYYDELVETREYKMDFVSSSAAGTIYVERFSGGSCTYSFSPNRNMLVFTLSNDRGSYDKRYFKRVDKSFFRIGRSRTPNGTLHE